MRKVNTNDIAEEVWSSAKGKFAGGYKGISLALGRKEESSDLKERHPFDVEICRVPSGKRNLPYHSHSAQWEFYHVIAGKGCVRHEGGITAVVAGDAFIFEPGQSHQIINDSSQDLVLYVIADSPSASPAIFRIATNGWCVLQSVDTSVRSLSSTKMERNEYFHE